MEMHLFAPMRIEQTPFIVLHETCDQLPKGGIRACLDRAPGRAEIRRQIESAQRLPGNNAPASSATPFQCPEKFGVLACVYRAHLSVSRYDFRFQQMGRCRAEAL